MMLKHVERILNYVLIPRFKVRQPTAHIFYSTKQLNSTPLWVSSVQRKEIYSTVCWKICEGKKRKKQTMNAESDGMR
jgi:hypothetical protein